MRFSRWVKFFNFGEFTALFHSLTLAVSYFPNDAIQELIGIIKSEKQETLSEIFDRDVLDSLLREKIIVPEDTNDHLELLEIRRRLNSNITLDMMYLILSDNCNLKCSYCFEDSPMIEKSFTAMDMENETAIQAVKYFEKISSLYGKKGRSKIIHLYGGEPLLNFNAIQVIVEKIDEMKFVGGFPDGCDLVLVTNGVLLNDEVADFIAAHGIHVGISIDGPEEINNLYRIGKKSCVNSYKSALEAYNRLKLRGVETGLSATLTPDVIRNFDNVLDFFVNKIGIKDGISFNIMHYNPAIHVDEEYFEEAAATLIKSYETFRKLGIYKERMMRKVSSFINREPIYADCGVVGGQIIVAPDGKIGVCQDFVKPRTYFGGTVFDDGYDPVKCGLFDGWSTRSPFFMQECLDCESIGICGGGCPASVELSTGSRWNIDKRICSHSKKSLEWMLLNTYLQMNGG